MTTTINNELTWQQIFKSNLKYFYLAIIIYLIIFWQINMKILLFFQHRPEAVILYDPILNKIPAFSLSFYVDAMIYITIILLCCYYLTKPRLFFIVLTALLLMWSLRWLTMYFLPLAAPPGYTVLHDPLAYSNHVITRDLFFSGHTATICILLFALDNKILRLFSFIMLIVIVLALLVAHYHYTIDIICAPFFAYVTYRISKKMNEKAILRLSKQ